jgi:peptidoglycan DL-endopeptidase CwlO
MIRRLMKKSKLQKTKELLYTQRLVIGVLIAVLTGSFFVAPVLADQFDVQINQLQTENDKKKNEVQALQIEASSLQGAINALQAQISGLESQIQTNQNTRNSLQDQITKLEIRLEEQKDLLGENIKEMYLEGQISTLEMLASSRDLSEFVDKEQYRNSVKDKIKTTLEEINALNLQLKTQKNKIEKLLAEQEQLRGQIGAQKAEQDRLLGLNQGQRAAFEQQIQGNQDKINELKLQQSLENIRLFGGGSGTVGGGGYPWGRAACLHNGRVEGACPNYDWAIDGSVWNWQTGGYGYRNCTDWVAFRVKAANGHAPAGLGHANTWDDRAPSYGYEVGSSPRRGAAAVSNSGFYGHVMYVEQVHGDGSVVVSDYNRTGLGTFNITTLSASQASSLRYVYF